MNILPYEKERKKVILLVLPQSWCLHSFQKMELVRLRPSLPGQRAGAHCVRAGLAKSTSFPRAVKKGIGGAQQALKEDCGNKISVRDRERKEHKEGY